MKKSLFYTGLGLQGIHLIIFLSIGLTLINWNFLTKSFILLVGYISFNISSLTMLVLGLVTGKNK